MALGTLHVISCGLASPLDPVLFGHPEALSLLQQAQVVFGSQSLLTQWGDWVSRHTVVTPVIPVPAPGVEIHRIGSRAVDDARTALLAFQQGKRVVVLASGDALFHGFGGTLARVAKHLAQQGEIAQNAVHALCYLPNITIFQALFHQLGLSWSQARLFSVHSNGVASLRQAASAPLAVVYGGSAAPAHLVARQIVALHPQAKDRPAIMAENMGTPGQRIVQGTLGVLAQQPTGPTSFVVLLPHANPHMAPVLALGLPDDTYERENNLITGAEARAVALACLRLPPWGVLWDVGAGSGSVGLEAAALCPNLTVIAVEKNPQRAAMIARNAMRLGVSNHEVLVGDACHMLKTDLPAPHRIFVGGGGAELGHLLSLCHHALLDDDHGGRMVVAAVSLETLCLLQSWNPQCRVGQCAVDVAREQPLGDHAHYLQPKNRITLCTWKK